MNRGLVVTLILVTSILQVGFAQDTQSRQNSANITGAELLRMLRSSSSGGVNQASALIGEVYAPKLNNGIIPDDETLYGLGRILMTYMIDHPASQSRSVEELVLEVLKNAPAQTEELKAFWKNAYQAAKTYFSKPSPDNAEKFYKALPDKRLPSLDFKGLVRLGDLIYGSYDNFSILEKNMEEGEPSAVDVGFRLINIADGAFAEDLTDALGKILPRHPRLFLQKLLAHQGKTEPTVFYLLNDLLCPTAWGEIQEDEEEAEYKELIKTRLKICIKALESVGDPELKEIRDKCLSILKKRDWS